MGLRAGNVPQTNRQLTELSKANHATNQGDLVSIRNMERTLARKGLKTQEIDTTKGIPSQINSMDRDTLASYLTNLLKTHKQILSLRVFKDVRLKDDTISSKHTRKQLYPIGAEVGKQINRVAEVCADNYAKPSIAGFEARVNQYGVVEFHVWQWTNTLPVETETVVEATEAEDSKKKAKTETREVPIDPRPYVALDYLLQ